MVQNMLTAVKGVSLTSGRFLDNVSKPSYLSSYCHNLLSCSNYMVQAPPVLSQKYSRCTTGSHSNKECAFVLLWIRLYGMLDGEHSESIFSCLHKRLRKLPFSFNSDQISSFC